MPRSNQPKTLHKLTLLTITYNWDWLCYSCPTSKDMGLLIEDNSYINKQSPFKTMPSPILEDLLLVISERRNLSRKHLHLLCLEQLRCLNLGFGTCGEIYYAFQFMKRTKRLERLSLAYQRDIAPSNLMALLPSLTCLTSINLQMTCAVDKLLEMIGIHCPNLTELNLTQTMISDNGIRRLCESNDQVRCTKLRRLAINETQVTWVGAHIALSSLPALSEFEYDRIFQVFQCLDNNELSQKQTKLKSLVSNSCSIIADSIDTAALLCPDVEILSVSYALIFNETLYRFMQFEKLRSITIMNHEDLTLDYYEGVLPLLQVTGLILENLVLDNFPSLDLSSLGRSCPVLRKLGLSNIVEYRLECSSDDLFPNLRSLELWLDSRTEFVSTSILGQLLATCSDLTDLLVKKCGTLNSESMRSIWQTNEMRRLNRLTFDECASVDWNLLDALLRMDNDISVIRIWSCSKITRTCKESMLKFIDESNLDVYLQWIE